MGVESQNNYCRIWSTTVSDPFLYGYCGVRSGVSLWELAITGWVVWLVVLIMVEVSGMGWLNEQSDRRFIWCSYIKLWRVGFRICFHGVRWYRIRMLSILWDILTTSVCVVIILSILLLAYLTKRHFKTVSRVIFYKDQGMSTLPGYDKFIFGNFGAGASYGNSRRENAGKYN